MFLDFLILYHSDLFRMPLKPSLRIEELDQYYFFYLGWINYFPDNLQHQCLKYLAYFSILN